MTQPLLSYIVLLYNYEHYVGQTIDSVLRQGVQDFEIVVIDDASTDRSRAVVEAFGDPRIRVHTNVRNLGGAGSYNVAVGMARGEFLVNLDADDWVAPEKARRQLDAFAADPSLDIIGTHVAYVDADGHPHSAAETLEWLTNRPYDFNRVDTWIVQNPLCRSSTMMRRDSHLRIGLDDAAMFRTPDYELWTRALRLGCRFALLPEKLTYYRLHSRGVTFADPLATVIEIAYLMRCNVIPLIEERAMFASYGRIFAWFQDNQSFLALPALQRYRLFAYLAQAAVNLPNYESFYSWLMYERSIPADVVGRNILALMQGGFEQQEMKRLRWDISEQARGIAWWREQAETWEQACRTINRSFEESGAEYVRAVEWWRTQAQTWESAYRDAVGSQSTINVR